MTENKMTVFSNSEFGQIRTLESNGKIIFCGTDVARALGYSRPNDAISAHCRCTVKHSIPHPQSKNKNIDMTFITEGDVYRLIVRSKLPDAEKFETWLFDTMLPTINQTGGYIVPGREKEFIDNNPAIVAELQQLRTAVEIMQAQLMTTPDTYAQNTWKKNISQPLARKVQEKYAVGDKDAYKMIYIEMQSQFGFDGISAIIAYHHKYNLAQTVHVSAITAIADNEVYQGYFSQAANRLLAEHEVAPDDLITAVSKALGYSKPCATVYSKIYSRMNTARGWKHMLTRHKCRTKKELIENNKEYSALYVKCCNEILNEHK